MTASYDILVFISSVYYFIIHLDNTKDLCSKCRINISNQLSAASLETIILTE